MGQPMRAVQRQDSLERHLDTILHAERQIKYDLAHPHHHGS